MENTYERLPDAEYEALLRFCVKHHLICFEYHRRHPEALVKAKGSRRNVKEKKQ